MTGREWQPGDVANTLSEGGTQLAFRTSNGWTFIDGSTSGECADDYGFRHVVVIDPEDREQVERLVNLVDDCFNDAHVDGTGLTVVDLAQIRLREFASPSPPKPDEPGTWGVVEASCVHSARRLHWMRHADDNWWPFAPYGEDDRRPLPDDWDSLVDPVVVRDGVAGEPS